MGDVIELLDLYGRSALGGTADQISGRQFIDFYESEIYTRYTGTLGTGTITEAILDKLKTYSNLVEFRTSSPLAELENTESGVRAIFGAGDIGREVVGKHAIFAASVSLAPHLIKDLEKQDPEKVKAISEIQMTDYTVNVIRLKGHPFRATYDTWSNSGGDPTKPSDYILGRWQDPKIQAYAGMRQFESDPIDNYGVISAYHPLGKTNPANFTTVNNLKRVDADVEDMITKLSAETAASGQKIEVELVESYQWPQSIHLVTPGYLKKTPILERPTGHIHYANNTISAPELETSMARAAREALQIIKLDQAAQVQPAIAVGQ